MSAPSPRASVIVPVHGPGAGLDACLTALRRQSVPRASYEVIVVNDGPVHPEIPVTTERYGARFLAQPRAGAGAARNRGAAEARGEILLFTDADCVPAGDWVEALTDPFSDSDVVGVSGTIHTRQAGVVPRYIQLEYDQRYETLRRRERIDFISTANAAYARRVFLAAGGFDASLWGAEDAEFSFRLASQGHRLIFAPHAVVYHRHPRYLIAYIRRKAHYGRWRIIVYGRHPDKVAADSRTPQTQKLRIGLVGMLGVTLLGALFWRRLAWVAALLALGFLIAALPFWLWSMRRDRWVGLLTPLLLAAGTAGAALGVTAGLAHRTLHRLGIAPAVPAGARRSDTS